MAINNKHVVRDRWRSCTIFLLLILFALPVLPSGYLWKRHRLVNICDRPIILLVTCTLLERYGAWKPKVIAHLPVFYFRTITLNWSLHKVTVYSIIVSHIYYLFLTLLWLTFVMFVAKSIPVDHKDLIHDVSYDFHGTRMATCSSDQSVKVITNFDEYYAGMWIHLHAKLSF